MLRINFSTFGMLNTGAITNITIDAKGTNTSTVSAVRLYYTGSDATFSTAIQLGSITTGPVGGEYVFTINQTLPHGANNF
jgi:hypothetical protein